MRWLCCEADKPLKIKQSPFSDVVEFSPLWQTCLTFYPSTDPICRYCKGEISFWKSKYKLEISGLRLLKIIRKKSNYNRLEEIRKRGLNYENKY